MTLPMVSLARGGTRLSIDPERGGSITELVAGPAGDSWLFHDPSRRAGKPADHPLYDDVWCGGFEELFPNDAPGVFDGRDLPDHGELWNHPFEVLDVTGATVWLRRRCVSVPADVEKAIAIEADGAVTLRYRLASRADAPLWHLFKLHPAMRVEPGDRLLLPGGSATAVEPGFGPLATNAPFLWPIGANAGGAPVDISLVRPASERFREFVYVSDLPEGWCGIRRARTGEALRIGFPLEVFPYCWLFLTYGGWRDYFTAVLEPCTNLPKDLASARARGSCAMLRPGEEQAFGVRVEVLVPSGR